MRKFALATAILLVAAPAAQSQAPPERATRLSASPALAAKRVDLKPTAVQLTALSIAKARPQALQLRATIAQLPRNRIDLAAVDRSRVPVLVSARPALLANLRVFAATDRYTASTTRNGMVVEINGTRAPHPAPRDFRMPRVIPTIPLSPRIEPRFVPGRRPIAPPPADALTNVSVERTSYGVDVSFMRFGSVYNVTMDCGAEANDPEAIGPAPGGDAAAPSAPQDCSEDGALALVKELEVAGGGEVPR